MAIFVARVRAHCATKEQAERVLNERLNHDQDFGFEYEVEWERMNPLVDATRMEETRI